MAKKAGGHDYLGMDRVLSIILAIIPVTSCVLGVITRIKEGHVLAGVLRLLLGWNIIYICDLVLIILQGKILRVL